MIIILNYSFFQIIVHYALPSHETRDEVYDVKWDGTTLSDKALYEHVLIVALDGIIQLPSVNQKILSAKCLNDNSKVSFVQSDKEISLNNLANKNNAIDLKFNCSVELFVFIRTTNGSSNTKRVGGDHCCCDKWQNCYIAAN